MGPDGSAGKSLDSQGSRGQLRLCFSLTGRCSEELVLTMRPTVTQVLTVASSALYHRAIPLSQSGWKMQWGARTHNEAHRDPGSHGGELSTLPPSYPAIPVRVKDTVRWQGTSSTKEPSWVLFIGLLLPCVSRYADYTIATKLQAGQGWHSRSWLCPGPAPLFQSTRWFTVKRRLQDWSREVGGRST